MPTFNWSNSPFPLVSMPSVDPEPSNVIGSVLELGEPVRDRPMGRGA